MRPLVTERHAVNEISEELIRDTVQGLSRFVILWLINQGPMSGYSILKRMEQVVEHKFTAGVIYSLLYEMEEDGYLAGRWSYKGRKRIKYYSVTSKGVKSLERVKEFFHLPVRDALRAFLREEPHN